jgi:hypothetical protein
MVQDVVVGSRGRRQTNQPDYEFLLDVLTAGAYTRSS